MPKRSPDLSQPRVLLIRAKYTKPNLKACSGYLVARVHTVTGKTLRIHSRRSRDELRAAIRIAEAHDLDFADLVDDFAHAYQEADIPLAVGDFLDFVVEKAEQSKRSLHCRSAAPNTDRL